jgi:hypothetical protein
MREALQQILEIAYSGHPDGREARLAVIERIAKAALENDVKALQGPPSPSILRIAETENPNE